MSEGRVVILGLGNLLLQDEGVGVHVAQRLAQMPLPAGVEVAEGGTAPLEALTHVENIAKLIIVDAIEADSPPGAVYRLKPADIAGKEGPWSLHEANLAEALTTWQYWGLPLDRVTIFGIVPRVVDWGTQLSLDLAAKLDCFISLILAEVGKAEESQP